jgi:hypothetical protein
MLRKILKAFKAARKSFVKMLGGTYVRSSGPAVATSSWTTTTTHRPR